MTFRPALLRLSGLLLVVALVPGCASVKNLFGGEEESLENVPVEQLYARGHASMTGSNWSRAEQHFARLMAQYPYGPYTEQALMETAYAQYKSGKQKRRSPPSTDSCGPIPPTGTCRTCTTCAGW